MIALSVALLAGCEESATEPTESRFGQVGRIQIEVSTPVLGQLGELNESLIWNSNGPWVLAERVSYRREQGGEHLRRSERNPSQLAQEYATFIRALSDSDDFRLFDGLSQELQPTCQPPLSRVTLVIRDDVREETARWIRCARGTLFDLHPADAGPDPGASRLISAGESLRLATLGADREAVYQGTLPFAILDRGEDSPARPEASRVFLSSGTQPPPAFLEFWEDHAGEGAFAPNVDWANEAVILAAVGERQEAGETVEVRRVLPEAFAARVEVVQRVRGNFCAPAARRGYPYQLVVVPRAGVPMEFAQPQVERVHCEF